MVVVVVVNVVDGWMDGWIRDGWMDGWMRLDGVSGWMEIDIKMDGIPRGSQLFE